MRKPIISQLFRQCALFAVIAISPFSSRIVAQTTSPAPLAEAQKQQWITMINAGKADLVITEVERTLAEKSQPASNTDLLYVLARAHVKQASGLSRAMKAVDAFIASAPKDERGGELLFRLGGAEKDPPRRIAAYQRAVQDFPQTSWAQNSKGAIRRIQSIGQPFDLKFTDAISGKTIDVQKDFKGKVVVIEFWAGWCSDCAAETPRIKALYEQYKNDGVEFIGVSLDRPETEGGLTVLKSAVAKQGITWPQYYQGNYFQSEFSAGWGVNAIPWAFILDKQGNLQSANALPDLEKLIPQLLALTP